ncbi:MAG: sulfotransferase [Anaerolineae bacterium]|nr:sulfotransferase [Anaerolineae bacterium]
MNYFLLPVRDYNTPNMMSHDCAGSTITLDQFAIIIGAMKSGTTTLFAMIGQHPEICPSVIKEVEYFSENQPQGIHGQGIPIEKYEELWNFNPEQHRFALEASTGYSKYPFESDVPRKIHSYGLQPKFVYILRNPVDRIESHFKYHAWAIENAINSDPCSPFYTEISKYHQQLSQYMIYFPRSSILILDFDELCTHPAVLCQRVWTFLGVRADFIPDMSPLNQTRMISPQEYHLRQSRWGALFKFTSLMPGWVKHAGRSIVSGLFTQNISLTLQQRSQIRTELSADMQALKTDFGIDVSRWGF